MDNHSCGAPAPDHPSDIAISDPKSLIWQNAIQRYYDELRRGGIKGPAIDKDLWNIKSPIDLLEEVKNLEPPDSRASRAWLGSLHRLKPILLGLNDFASVTAWALGMNGKVAAVVWGSIRLILNVSKASSHLNNLTEPRRACATRFARDP
jgi:hypothetical protein